MKMNKKFLEFIGFKFFIRRLVQRASIKLRNILATSLHNVFFGNAVQSFIFKKAKMILSVDLHISVSRDLITTISQHKINFFRWSISTSSHLFKEPNLRLRGVNSLSWATLNESDIGLFQAKYESFLKKVDAFIVTHSLSMINLYKNLDKPIFAINSTRYESPYTFSKLDFVSLNSHLHDLRSTKMLDIVSNNQGDKDYLKLLGDLESTYIPSLCDYTETNKPSVDTWIISCRNSDLANHIAATALRSQTSEKLFPSGFTYREISKYKGVILIPYNISTMRLFELTTAGFPVRIPSDRLMMEWSHLPGVLSELSWVQVHNMKTPEWLSNTPADPEWDGFYKWWLERADWNDTFFFPNISRFDSLDELNLSPPVIPDALIFRRNLAIQDLWKAQLSLFMNKIK
jgi:hypothetical protein